MPSHTALPQLLVTLRRYAGTDVAVMTAWVKGSDPAAAFAAAYQREFGFVLDRPVVVDDVRVRATGRAAELPKVQVSGCEAFGGSGEGIYVVCTQCVHPHGI